MEAYVSHRVRFVYRWREAYKIKVDLVMFVLASSHHVLCSFKAAEFPAVARRPIRGWWGRVPDWGPFQAHAQT